MVRHRLILTRHAKSSWATPGLRDHDRPLNKRGTRSCHLIGTMLRDSGFLPEVALVSTARRCVETFEGLVQATGTRVPCRLEPGLYHGSGPGMLDILRRAREPVVLMIGHNPGIAHFASWLLSNPADADRHEQFRRYPTAATSVIDFDVESWNAVREATGRLIDFRIPRELES